MTSLFCPKDDMEKKSFKKYLTFGGECGIIKSQRKYKIL